MIYLSCTYKVNCTTFWGEKTRHPTCTLPSGEGSPAPYLNHPRAAGCVLRYSRTGFNLMAIARAQKAALKLAVPRTPCPQS